MRPESTTFLRFHDQSLLSTDEKKSVNSNEALFRNIDQRKLNLSINAIALFQSNIFEINRQHASKSDRPNTHQNSTLEHAYQMNVRFGPQLNIEINVNLVSNESEEKKHSFTHLLPIFVNLAN